jgi:hypothetical protein
MEQRGNGALACGGKPACARQARLRAVSNAHLLALRGLVDVVGSRRIVGWAQNPEPSRRRPASTSRARYRELSPPAGFAFLYTGRAARSASLGIAASVTARRAALLRDVTIQKL